MSNKKSDFWYYTRGERRATFSLLILAVLLFLFPAIYDFRPVKEDTLDSTTFIRAIQALEASQAPEAPAKVASVFYFDPNTADQEVLVSLGLSDATARTIINYREKVGSFQKAEDLKKIYNLAETDFDRLAPYIKIQAAAKPVQRKSEPPIALFNFDPNTADRKDLIRLGLSPKTAGTLISYREKGGRFHKKEDLKKIYGLREQDYRRLEAFISIPLEGENDTAISDEHSLSASKKASALPVSYEVPAPVVVDVNQATAADWQKLYGIGPVLSGRIVKFRDKLGGFTRIEQVAETYGLADSTFQSIRSQLELSPVFQKIAINKATAKELQAHPYIKWQQANVIVAYRQEHGPYLSVEDLEKVLALTPSFISQVSPYLNFEPKASTVQKAGRDQ